ncbi:MULTISPECIES: hypothetical protein [unclassified Mesorhizobium]|jgi:hypothetical protein|uniref:hypothetical protein n=1 Tax=unclassified Mesorhizobium TaxID=325217 RepID=UPI0008E77060|nr:MULTISPECIES: hypothetical protein [unclassified Mesorhizobium]RJG47314.1 hypothetical protein D3Y55_18060 [Mesorhizobium sp. DCY119]SFT95760.1 hypothetical protein SAMN05518861_10884 [Mesorhizobium sp. YR577]
MSKQPVAEKLVNVVSENATELPAKGKPISEQDFETVIRGALDAVNGTLLFKMRVDEGNEPHHAAAAFVGDGEKRQFLVMTMPLNGGQLRVETAAKSKSPIAGIAAAYAGLADAFATAA